MQSSTSRNASASPLQSLSLSSIKSKPSPHSNNTRKRLRSPEEWDELDLIICHEEFTSLVALVERVKHAQERLHRLSRASPDIMDFYDQHKPSVPKSCLSAGEVLAVVERMREYLSHADFVIRRGSYPVTDATMDDNFSILQKELDFCESCLRHHNRQLYQGTKMASPHSSPPSIAQFAATPITPSSTTRNATTSTPSTTATTTKYSKWQSDILLQWLVDNHKDPTMSRSEVKELAHRTALTTSQVSTWLQNMKRRRKKNTIAGTKKATHFLDFLFLANEREENDGKLPPCIDGSVYETPKKKYRREFPARDFIPFTPSPEQAYPAPPPNDDDDDDDDNFSVNPDCLFSGLGTVTESFDSLPVDPSNEDDDEAKELLSLFASTWYEQQNLIVASTTWNSQSSKNTSHEDYMEIHSIIKANNSDLHEARDDFEGFHWDDLDFSSPVQLRIELAKIQADDRYFDDFLEKEN